MNRFNGIRFQLGLVFGAVLIAANLGFWFAFLSVRADLEADAADALSSAARMMAGAIPGEYVAALRPGDEQSRTYQNLHQSLLRGIDGFRLTRSFVIDADGDFLVDTESNGRVGNHAFLVDAAAAEMAAALAGETATTVVYGDADGILVKSAYTPVRHRDGSVVGVLVVEASARFLGQLGRIQRVMFAASAISGVAVIALLILLSVSVVRPILKLRHAVGRIARGDYGTVHSGGASELRFLASSFNTMSDALGKKEQELRALYEREAKRAQELEHFAEAILRSIANGIVSVDKGGAIHVCNAEACRILGVDEDALLGTSMQTLPPVLAEVIEQVLSTGSPTRRDGVHFANKAGDDIAVSVAAALNAGGAAKIAVNLIITDQTEVIELQEKIKRQETLAAIGQLAAHVAHEVRNPLSSIKVYMDLIARAKHDDLERRGFIAKISGEISRLDNIVGDFLKYAAPTRMNQSIFHLSGVADDAVMFSRKRENRGVEYRGNLSEHVDVLVEADRGQMMQMLLNLIINAVDAMPGGGIVTTDIRVAAGGSPRNVAVTITDTGTGIPEEVRDDLFKPFVSTKSLGTGLGLAMVQRVVENHGGTIDIESAPGKGTAVTVTLPIVVEEEQAKRGDG